MRRIIKTIIRALQCPKCPRWFEDKNELAYHLKYEH